MRNFVNYLVVTLAICGLVTTYEVLNKVRPDTPAIVADGDCAVLPFCVVDGKVTLRKS